MNDQTKRTAELNDLFRQNFSSSLGKVFHTRGISRLSELAKVDITYRVKAFRDFTEDNDPHGEHDFGGFECGREKVFWTIDYYDQSMTAESEDPSDPAQTTRVLTIMLASEY